MKLFRSYFFYPILVSILAVAMLLQAGSIATAESSSENNVRFKWTFGAYVQEDGESKFITIDKDLTLHSGDRFKFYLKPLTECFIYVLFRGNSGEMYMLFPPSHDYYDRQNVGLNHYYLPNLNDWYQLDRNIGRETVFLLASTERLTEIEKLLKDYSAAGQEKNKLADEIVAEIGRTRKKHRKLTSTAGRPRPIGGNVRGMDLPDLSEDLADKAVAISASDFYARTITIDHQ